MDERRFMYGIGASSGKAVGRVWHLQPSICGCLSQTGPNVVDIAQEIKKLADAAALWSIHAMLDKASQFYLQASKQVEPPQLRLFFSNLAEIKLMLRRRVGAVERILANQAWKEIGFPPGLLGKE